MTLEEMNRLEEQLQVRKQYVYSPHGTVSLVMPMAMPEHHFTHASSLADKWQHKTLGMTRHYNTAIRNRTPI